MLRIGRKHVLPSGWHSALNNDAESAEIDAKTSVPSTPGEVVISPAEQIAQRIEVQAVQMRDLPAVLSLPGRIALPDNATWRVGVLTDGRVEKVYANLGD